MGDFEGRVALVTGATSGIGRATALAFGEAGASVLVTGRDEERGEEVVERVAEAGGRARFTRCDVRVEDEVERAVDAAIDAFGRLDVAFNNAGIEYFAELVDVPAASFDDVVATNLRGTYVAMKHEIPALERAGGGSIVNMSSVAGSDVGVPTNTPYSATKAGIEGMTRSAALEVAPKGIRVNAVVGCSIDTPTARAAWERLGGVEPEAIAKLNPVARLGRPEDVSRAVLFLSAEEASYITGTMLTVDGGFSISRL